MLVGKKQLETLSYDKIIEKYYNPPKNKNKPAMWETNYNPNYPFQTDLAALYITKSHFIFSLIYASIRTFGILFSAANNDRKLR